MTTTEPTTPRRRRIVTCEWLRANGVPVVQGDKVYQAILFDHRVTGRNGFMRLYLPGVRLRCGLDGTDLNADCASSLCCSSWSRTCGTKEQVA